MFRKRVFWPLTLLAQICVLSPTTSLGQFYAPNTEYHDLSQRCFVVEAARVLAARENGSRTNYALVTFEVETRPNRETAWKIQWRDARSNAIHQATVTYPESLLKAGPDYFRTVFRQLWGTQWRSVPKTSPTNLVEEFWKGVNESGYSRVETLRAAWIFEQSKPKEEIRAARLAGLLQGAAIPAISGALSIDALLLSRSAAWLCLAEMGTAETGRLDACWAPTLLLASREAAATALWKSRAGDMQSAPWAGPVSHGWDFLLQRPRAKAGYVYAVGKEHRRFALPVAIYYRGTVELGSTLATAIYAAFESDENTLARLYDYSPFVSLMSGVSGGRIMEGMWPTLGRLAWLESLQVQPLTSLDYSGHTQLVQKTQADLKVAMRKRPTDNLDASVLGLSEMSLLLMDAYREGLGPLLPVTVMTARDMLQYGWESTCVNLETRNRFVSRIWGVRDLSASIVTNSVSYVKGASPFFMLNSGREAPEMVARLRRMQFADASSYALRTFPYPVWSEEEGRNQQLYFRRCWLRPYLIAQQVGALLDQKQSEEIVPFLSRYHAEGGPVGDALALSTLVNNIPENTAANMPGKQKLQEDLAQALLEPSVLQINVSWAKKYEKMEPFERGKALERVFWDSPDVIIYGWIFHNYLWSHADTSAKRFYRQTADMHKNPIGFSSGIGQMRYAMAVLDGDRAGRKQALEDCTSGSQANMIMLMWEAILADDMDGLARQVDEAIERYPNSAAQMRSLRNFLPLFPAMANPKHPDREKALNYFANDTRWRFLQWIVIQKYKLSADDAARFLGGAETDAVRQAIISYVKKDKERFKEQFDRLAGSDALQGAPLVLLLRFKKELLEIKEPEGQQDLKPAGAQAIEQAMLEFLEKEKER